MAKILKRESGRTILFPLIHWRLLTEKSCCVQAGFPGVRARALNTTNTFSAFTVLGFCIS